MCGPRHLIKRNKADAKPVHTGGNGHGDTDDIGYGSYTLMGASPVWIEVVFSHTHTSGGLIKDLQLCLRSQISYCYKIKKH